MTETIVILGMQRSGTSALSGALARLGLDFGDPSMLYEGDASNPRGYYEHRQITALNLRALAAFQMHVTSFGSLPEAWRDHPAASAVRKSLIEFLRAEFGSRRLWALKHPLISLLVPLYNDVFSELGLLPSYLVCVRHPLEAMQSEARLEFGDSYRVMQSLGKMAVGSWLRYTLGAICEAQPNPTKLIPYEALLNDPRSILQSIVEAHSEWTPSPEQWEDAVASIDPGLRRNQRPVEDLDALPPIVRQTFDAVNKNAQPERFRGLYQEFKTWTAILGDPPPPPGKLGLSWTQDGLQRIAEQGFPVLSEWQTITLPIDAPPHTVLAGLLYSLPARIWIRRCIWRLANTQEEVRLKSGPCSELLALEGIVRLDAVFESGQIQLLTPSIPGPYLLELEILVETSPEIHRATAERLSRTLDHCASRLSRAGGAR